MTRYLLDTNVLIAMLQEQATVLERMRSLNRMDMYVSSIVSLELWYGVEKSQALARNTDRQHRLLEQFPQRLSFDELDARTAGKIRADLERMKQTIGPYDTLLAGQALARGLTLVTANEREFRRVKGLRVENWERITV